MIQFCNIAKLKLCQQLITPQDLSNLIIFTQGCPVHTMKYKGCVHVAIRVNPLNKRSLRCSTGAQYQIKCQLYHSKYQMGHIFVMFSTKKLKLMSYHLYSKDRWVYGTVSGLEQLFVENKTIPVTPILKWLVLTFWCTLLFLVSIKQLEVILSH